ncbi:MAG: HIT family protein, partial [Candidatus Rokuibacteriota bacterium]
MSGPCPACAGQWPADDGRVADCGLTVAYLHDDQFFAGWTVLVLKRHATELFALSPGERSRMVEE